MNPHTPITNLVWHIMGSILHLPTFMLILVPSARQNTSFSHMSQKFKAESFTAAATWLPSGVSPKFLQESLFKAQPPIGVRDVRDKVNVSPWSRDLMSVIISGKQKRSAAISGPQWLRGDGLHQECEAASEARAQGPWGQQQIVQRWEYLVTISHFSVY